MQRVIRIVHSTLCDLRLAIDGTIVMSHGLRASLDAMYDARIPECWLKVRIQNRCKVLQVTDLYIRTLTYFL
jgi:dynein heavy chain